MCDFEESHFETGFQTRILTFAFQTSNPNERRLNYRFTQLRRKFHPQLILGYLLPFRP